MYFSTPVQLEVNIALEVGVTIVVLVIELGAVVLNTLDDWVELPTEGVDTNV